ncbi:BCCT family transporter [Bacillus fonticola]|uniref:BCCT family transporter n=1 Tax=Bacillus fonticola TaxID=2728853 RepID=UPI0014765FC4|nr:BCCT family transporter [Bacillus fonticola]
MFVTVWTHHTKEKKGGSQLKSPRTDWPVVFISGGVLILFVILSWINMDFLERFVNDSFAWSANYFGAFWQLLVLAFFAVTIVMACSRLGRVKLGMLDKPETGYFKWISMIMCTLLASGGVFWAAAEPMFHYMEQPPMLPEAEAGSPFNVYNALAQSFLDWGFLAWTILGTLSTVVVMYGHYHKGMPLKPRTLFYPMFGKKIMEKNNVFGILVDAFSIIAVAAGTIGPIGLLGLQAAYGFESLFGVPNEYWTQALIIFGLVAISAISAATGIYKGIQLLSVLNIVGTLVLVVLMLVLGPAGFIIDSFLGGYGVYLREFFNLSLYRGDKAWLSLWTVFFWGWFLGYAPMMAIFIGRISRGRTIRQLFVAVAIIAPLVSNFWFTIVGGSGIFYEQQNEGSVTGALLEGGMPAAMISIVEQVPFGTVLAFAFLLVTILFVATTVDSMSYTIAASVTGLSDPPKFMRIFWALTMGAVAVVLLNLGENSVNSIQSFIVVTAVPVSLILLPSLWLAPQVAKKMAKEQGIQ